MTIRYRITAGDGDPRHGTMNGYHNHQCRCQPCKDAWADYKRDERHDAVPPPAGDPRHGRRNTYLNHNCRCRPCTGAHADYVRSYRRRLEAAR